jgi:acyl-homoserine lactone acylase PvdQ
MATKAPHTLEELEAEALKLDMPARAALAKSLLESLETAEEDLSQEEWNRVWGEEAEARYKDFLAGRTEAIDGDEVFAKIRARFR